jgi:hypothetical protein
MAEQGFTETNKRSSQVPALTRPKMIGVGLFVLACVTWVVYSPTLKMGFRFVDDYTYLYWAGSMPLPQYLIHSLDPRVQNINYRPLKRILILIEYQVFHSEASNYHFVQNLIHLANTLLVLAIVWRLSKHWRIAFLSALFYAGIPIASEAVFWISDEAPLATLFSLGALLFWVGYLQSKERHLFSLAISAFVLALLSKESAIVIPIVFFLMDRLLIRDQVTLARLLQRYVWIAIIVLVYLVLQFTIQQRGTFTNEGGYFFGEHIISNYLSYLAMLVFPWSLPRSTFADVTFGALGVFFIGIALLKRNGLLVCLALGALLAIGPVVLASLGPGPRYLYLATVAVAVLWSLGIEALWTRWKSAFFLVTVSIALAGLVVINGFCIADAAAELSEISRQQRVPFRDIMQQHPAFPPDTRLFLIEPPHNLSMMDIAGMFFLRYGKNVSVGGTFADGRLYTGGRLHAERARLSDYTSAYVYYFDEMYRPIEVKVQKDMIARASPELPRDLQTPIRLEGYEVTSTKIKKGEPLALILYWRATGSPDRDYTVFVHFVDAEGQIVTGDDSYPRNGKERTSEWRVGRFTADAHVLSIPQEAAVDKNYRLQVGLYYLPTMQRVSILNADGVPITDHIVIEPFEVVE